MILFYITNKKFNTWCLGDLVVHYSSLICATPEGILDLYSQSPVPIAPIPSS